MSMGWTMSDYTAFDMEQNPEVLAKRLNLYRAKLAELLAENRRLEGMFAYATRDDNYPKLEQAIDQLTTENKALRKWVRKAVEDSECGVIPRNHLDRGAALLQEQGE